MLPFHSKFSSDDAFAFIKEVTGNDEVMAATIEMIKEKTSGPQSDFAEHMDDDASLMQMIIDCLTFSGRLIELDWRAPIRDCVRQFSRLFTRAGIEIEAAKQTLQGVRTASPVKGPGLAYVAFRPFAEANNMRVMNLSNWTGSHKLILVPRAVAERWEWVVVGECGAFCDADFQFSAALKEVGIEPRYGKAPPAPRKPPGVK